MYQEDTMGDEDRTEGCLYKPKMPAGRQELVGGGTHPSSEGARPDHTFISDLQSPRL